MYSFGWIGSPLKMKSRTANIFRCSSTFTYNSGKMIILNQLWNKKTALDRAIGWIKKHRIGNAGIVVHHKTKELTPEVTGYLIESLYNAGEKEFAYDLARWEVSIQKPDGSFSAPGVQTAYTFDTAQVIRGFLRLIDDLPELQCPLVKACQFVISQIDQKGEVHTPDDSIWILPDGGKLSAYCNLYCLAPLLNSGKRLREQTFVNTAERSLSYYKNQPDITEFKPKLGTLSHIFGYMMEALAEMGETDLAKKGLEQAWKLQKADGSIPAYPGVKWVCATGLAQLGIASWMVGNREAASKALSYLEKIQNPGGGFYGGYG